MFSVRELDQFTEGGYIIVRNLFLEVEALRSAAEQNNTVKTSTFSEADGEGGSIDLALWNSVDDSIFGLFPQSERIVDRI